MKDYYQILEVTPSSSIEDIRRQYRKLAMQYHPDRNPGSSAAEEKFKEIAEAYGVLTDPVKRKHYDTFGAAGPGPGRSQQQGAAGGFRYSQEDILRDLFNDPHFQQMFQGVLREFQRSGHQASPQFIKRSASGGRGGYFLGSLFLIRKFLGPAIRKTAEQKLLPLRSFLDNFGTRLKGLFTAGEATTLKSSGSRQPPDTTFITRLSAAELLQGKVIQIVAPSGDSSEKLKVTVPPGSRAGQKLRLRGKGRPGPRGRGDLLLLLEERK